MAIFAKKSLKFALTGAIGAAVILSGAYYYYFYSRKIKENPLDREKKVIPIFKIYKIIDVFD